MPSQIAYLWKVYEERVHQPVTILHIPTTTKLVRAIQADLGNLTPVTEVLMFSIYYAAITSLDDDDVGVSPPTSGT